MTRASVLDTDIIAIDLLVVYGKVYPIQVTGNLCVDTRSVGPSASITVARNA